MSEVEPVAYRWTYDLGQAWNIGPNKPTDFRFGEPDEIQPLVRLSDAEARIAELIRNYDDAYNRGLIDGNRLSVEQQQAIHAAEARAEAAEALLKEAGKVLEPLCSRAENWPLNSDSARVSVRLGHLRAARSIAAKIGGRNDE